MSEDPIGFEAGDSNLYRYVGNSPVNFVDPCGMISTELIALLSIAQPRNGMGDSIYKYSKSPDYSTALSKATTWFYLITDPTRSTGKNINNPKISQLKWLLNAPLKLDPSLTSGIIAGGQASLRPAAASGDDPTIDLQPEKKTKIRHQTPGHENATEIKFEWKDSDKQCPLIPAIPAVNLSPYPQGEKDYPDPVQQPQPIPANPSLGNKFRNFLRNWPWGPIM